MTGDIGGNHVRDSSMAKDRIGGIAMMVSNDSKSFEGYGDKRSESPSSTSSISLGGLSMVSMERCKFFYNRCNLDTSFYSHDEFV
jgi:hypothetical protein